MGGGAGSRKCTQDADPHPAVTLEPLRQPPTVRELCSTFCNFSPSERLSASETGHRIESLPPLKEVTSEFHCTLHTQEDPGCLV